MLGIRNLLWLSFSTPFGITLMLMSLVSFGIRYELITVSQWLGKLIEVFRNITYSIISLVSIPFPAFSYTQLESDLIWMFYVFLPPFLFVPGILGMVSFFLKDWFKKDSFLEDEMSGYFKRGSVLWIIFRISNIFGRFITPLLVLGILALYLFPLIGFGFVSVAENDMMANWMIWTVFLTVIITVIFRMSVAAASGSLTYASGRNYIGLVVILWLLFSAGAIDIIERI